MDANCTRRAIEPTMKKEGLSWQWSESLGLQSTHTLTPSENRFLGEVTLEVAAPAGMPLCLRSVLRKSLKHETRNSQIPNNPMHSFGHRSTALMLSLALALTLPAAGQSPYEGVLVPLLEEDPRCKMASTLPRP